jgi:replication factor A1
MSAAGSTQRVPRISTAEHKKVFEIKNLHLFNHNVFPIKHKCVRFV